MGMAKRTVPQKLLTEVDAMVVRVWVADSISDPGIKHIVFQLDNGTYLCSCRGWQLNNKCWHTQRAESG